MPWHGGSRGGDEGEEPRQKTPDDARGCVTGFFMQKTVNMSSDRDDGKLNEKLGRGCSAIVAAAALELIGQYRGSVSPSKRNRKGHRDKRTASRWNMTLATVTVSRDPGPGLYHGRRP